MVRGELLGRCFTGNAFAGVPSSVVTFGAVDIVSTPRHLSLAKVLNCAELVGCNGFHIPNDFLNDDSLGVSIVNSFVLNGFLSSIQKALLSETKAVGARLSLDHGVRLPVILTFALLARVVVSVGALVHLRMLVGLGGGTTSREQYPLGISDVLGRHAKGNLTVLSLLRPVIVTLVASTEWLSLNRVVLALKCIVEFVSEATQILRLNHNVNVVRPELWLSVGMVLRNILFIVHEARVHLNLTRLHMCKFSVLLDVGWRARVARLLMREQIGSDAEV